MGLQLLLEGIKSWGGVTDVIWKEGKKKTPLVDSGFLFLGVLLALYRFAARYSSLYHRKAGVLPTHSMHN